MIELIMKIGATAAFVAGPALLAYFNAKRGTKLERVLEEVASWSISVAYMFGVGGAIFWMWGAA